MWNRLSGMRFLLFALLLGATACSTAATELPVAPVDGPVATTEAPQATSEAPQATSLGDDSVRVIEIELTEFAIAGSSFTFTPGETVEFVVTNSGVVEHEFRLSNADRVEEHLAGGHEDHDDSAIEEDHDDAAMEDMDKDESDHDDGDAHDEEAEDAVLLLAAGETGTMEFTFPDNAEDYTAAVCLIPGHYEAGMATDLSFES
ncbi:MAG: hypothetical protein IIC71_02845 [Acidobacteria bacterium]|nr:hypothetical protein [Acidobacteriota bacterium]